MMMFSSICQIGVVRAFLKVAPTLCKGENDCIGHRHADRGPISTVDDTGTESGLCVSWRRNSSDLALGEAAWQRAIQSSDHSGSSGVDLGGTKIGRDQQAHRPRNLLSPTGNRRLFELLPSIALQPREPAKKVTSRRMAETTAAKMMNPARDIAVPRPSTQIAAPIPVCPSGSAKPAEAGNKSADRP